MNIFQQEEIYTPQKGEKVITLPCGCKVSRIKEKKDRFIKVCQKHAYKGGVRR